MKRGAVFLALGFAVVFMGVTVLLMSEWGLQRVATAILPGSIKTDSLNGRLIGPINAVAIVYTSNNSTILLKDVSLDWNIFALLTGTIHLNNIKAAKVEYIAKTEKSNSAQQSDTDPIQLPEISLPVNIVIDSAYAQNITINVNKDSSESTEINDIKLSASLRESALHIDQLNIESPDWKIDLSGSVILKNNYSTELNIEWSLADLSQYNYKGQGVISGDANKLTVTHVLDGTVSAQLNGVIMNPVNKPEWQANIDIKNIIFADYGLDFSSGFPSDFPLDKDIKTFEAHIKGEGDLQSFSTQANVDSQLGELGRVIANFSLTHRPGKWVIEQLKLKQTPLDEKESEADLALSGEITLADIGHFDFSKNNIANLTLDGDWNKIHWPIDSKTTLRSNTGKFSVQGLPDHYLLNVDGDLQGHPIKGVADIKIDGDTLKVQEFKINSGSMSVTSTGEIADKWDLDLKTRVGDVGQFIPAAKGEFKLSGYVYGHRETPHIQLSVTGSSLSYDSSAIKKINAKVDLDIADKQISTISMSLNDINVSKQKIDTLQLLAKGYLSDHAISLQSVANTSNAKVSLKGKFSNNNWVGKLEKIEVQHAPVGKWQILEAADLRIQEDVVSLSNTCLFQDNSKLCGQIEWKKQKSTQGQLTISQLPISIIQALFGKADDLQITGTLGGQAFVNYFPDYNQRNNQRKNQRNNQKNTQTLNVNASLALSSGKFILQTNEGVEHTFNYLGGDADILLNGKGAQGKLNWVLNKDDEVKANFVLPGWQYGIETQDQSVSAQATYSTSELGFLSLIIPGLEHVSGELATDVGVSGTVKKPVIKGVVALQNGAVSLPQIGITLKNIALNAKNENDNLIQIQGFAESAKGELNIQGKVELDNLDNNIENLNEINANIEFTGKDFEIVNLPEANIFVSPDLQLLVSGKRVDLVGSIAVPKAIIKPKDVSNTVSVSDDVVIIDQSSEAEKNNNQTLYASVRVDLGDNVKFSGFGVDGNIVGSVVAVSEPNKATSGYGELNIKNGTYKAFEKSLELDLGRLSFIGNPIINPNINARAIRKLENILAGVQVRGQLAAPQLTLFSEPPMEDANILSYLLVGVPVDDIPGDDGGEDEDRKAMLVRAASQYKLNKAFKRLSKKFGMEEIKLQSGETASDTTLVIGKYLNPQLYVNYSIGISGAVNILRLRYKIGSKWILQSESGENNSADFLYTYER